MATPSQLWSTGPALFYAGRLVDPASAAAYIGTCDDKPVIEIEEEYEPVHNDLAGRKPMDKMFVGDSGLVVCDFGKFSYPVLQALSCMRAADALGADPTAVPGRSDPGDIGTLMFLEGKSFVLYIVFPKFANPAYAAQGAVAGYRFPFTTVNKQSIASGTTAHKRRLVFECERAFDATVSNGYGVGRFTLYDHLAALSILPAPI